MQFLVDAYNLFFRFTTQPPTASRRQQFLQRVDYLLDQKKFGATVVLVFDSQADFAHSPATSSHCPSRRAMAHLDVVFAPCGMSADTYLIEWISCYKCPKQLTLVTSDHALQQRAAHFQVDSLLSERFLELISAHPTQSLRETPSAPQVPSVSPREHLRWLSIFERGCVKDDGGERVGSKGVRW